MNNPHIKKFLDAIERAAPLHVASDLAFRAQHATFCSRLRNVSYLLWRVVPEEQRLQLTGKRTRRDTMCIAGNQVFTFSFDDVPVITTKNDKPLLPQEPDKYNLDDLIGISEDFSLADRDWPEYKEYVERKYRYKEREYGIELPVIDNTLVGESSADKDNVKILPAASHQGFSEDEDFLRHINANADFFKRLIELGKPTRNIYAHSADQHHQYRDGVAFAMPITIDMFVDCRETEIRNRYRVGVSLRPKVGVEESEESYVITRKGLFCMDLEGVYFVMVGYQDRDREGGREGTRYFSVDTVSLAIPFGQPRPKESSPTPTPVDTRMDPSDVTQFVRSIVTMFREDLVVTLPQNEVQSLEAAAFGTLLEKAKSIAEIYEDLRYLPKQLHRSRLVLVQGKVVYIMTRRARADMLRDFPQYVNRRVPEEDNDDGLEYKKTQPHELPINEEGTYYTIDDTRGNLTNADVVGVGIDYCGFLDGKKVQPIRFIRSDGSFFTEVVDFVYPFDDYDFYGLGHKRKR